VNFLKEVTAFSSFILGPNDSLEKKISDIKKELEMLNKNSEVNIEIIDETTENCASGCKMYTYKWELREKQKTGFSGPRTDINF
jgi:hypothetical protein